MEKKDAGAELISICKSMTDAEPKEIGKYKGFTLLLAFYPTQKSFGLTLKNELSHQVSLGTDIYGNIQRIDNLLSGLGSQLEEYRAQLRETQKQMESAMEEVNKPFEQEAELEEKSARLAELNAQFNMDKRENEIADEGQEEEPKKERDYAMER